MRFRTILSIPLFLSLFSTNRVSLYGQTFTLSAASDLVRVFEDGYQLPEMTDTIKVFGIRGETLSGQLIINTRKKLNNVQVEVSSLTLQNSSLSIPSDRVEWNFVGSIPLSENAPNQPPQVLTRAAPALFPDYLMEERQISLNKNTSKSIWLTIHVPQSIDAGEYMGHISVIGDQENKTLPLSLKIYPLNLPEDRHLKIAEWYSTGHFEDLHGVKEKYSEEWFDILKAYAENMAEHRQNVFQVPMNSIVIHLSPNGEFLFDFSRFDQIAKVFWDTGKMDYLETGELTRFGEKVWFDTEIEFKEFTIINDRDGKEMKMTGLELIPQLFPVFESHLRQKGWLDKTLFHVKDEPTLRNVRSWKEASSLINRYAPDLIRIDAIETTFLFDEIEIAIPKLDYLDAWYDVYEKAARDGTELWFYTVGIYQASGYPNKTIDMPLIDNRILHWLNYKYDLKGFLHWGWNQWTENPFEATGMHIGDGWHVYPKKDGVLNSLRWEQMRNGLQDYEFFWMLENKIQDLKDSLGSRFSWIDPKQRGKEIVGEVVKDLLEHNGDPRVLYHAKKEVIKEILDFNQSPRVYIQTNPQVNAKPVKEGSYLVEVFGWAEKGTNILINGENIEVNEQGMFLYNLSLAQEENLVIIDAKSDRGNKKIVRSFIVNE